MKAKHPLPDYFIRVDSGGTCNFGQLENEAAKTVSQGTQISLLSATGAANNFVILNNGGNLNFYGSSISSNGLRIRSVSGGTTRIWGAIVTNTQFEGAGYDFYSVIINGGTPFGSIYYDFSAIIDRIIMNKPDYVFCLSYLVTEKAILRNLYSRGHTYVVWVYPTGSPKIDVEFINADFDEWKFSFYATYTGKVWRKNEFDVHVQDKKGNALSGVSVVAEYISPFGQAFSATTDSNGDIPTQTVDRSWYEQKTGDIENLKTPLKVTYKKAGYQTVVKYYPMNQKTVDRVVMHKAVSVFLSLGQPILNLKKTDPENKNVLVL